MRKIALLFGLTYHVFQNHGQAFTPQIRQYIKDSAAITVGAGKRTDLVLIDGGFDSPKIFASVKGWVGIN